MKKFLWDPSLYIEINMPENVDLIKLAADIVVG
ncbi:unnamed protein product, partial [marine sediment metagenome]